MVFQQVIRVGSASSCVCEYKINGMRSIAYYLALRDIHSFPTRRSSDLEVETAAIVPITGDRGLAGAFNAQILRRSSAKDRKSTRLNSSHEWNAYAVVCLQKKKATHKLLQIQIL